MNAEKGQSHSPHCLVLKQLRENSMYELDEPMHFVSGSCCCSQFYLCHDLCAINVLLLSLEHRSPLVFKSTITELVPGEFCLISLMVKFTQKPSITYIQISLLTAGVFMQGYFKKKIYISSVNPIQLHKAYYIRVLAHASV